MNKVILISGITGQDGSYMAEYCLNLGHKVYGMVRRTSQINDINYKHLKNNPNFQTVYGDLLDGPSLDSLVRNLKPDYFINFAAQSFVGCSWDIPEETFMASAVGVLKCLEAIRKNAPNCRFYNAGSSEQFGDVVYTPQDEKHPFRPRSPYGAAKCASHFLVKVYRESYGLYAIQGLLFNHESERRGEEFVTRKITKGLARIANSIKNREPFDPIRLGNLDAKRDWSHAEDFVDGVWRMLNQEKYNQNIKNKYSEYYNINDNIQTLSKDIKEYVLASGKTHTVRDFINQALKFCDIEGFWNGEGINEKFHLANYLIENYDLKSSILIEVDSKFFRPAEVNLLLGNSELARKELGWEPKISFDKLVERMVSKDIPDEKVQK